MNMNKMITFAAVAASAVSMNAFADWGSNTYTQEVNGIAYILKTNPDGRITIGPELGQTAGSSPAGTVERPTGVLHLPDSFVVDDVEYPATGSLGLIIGHSAFAGCVGLTSVIFPKDFYMGISSSFSGCSNLESIWIKGSKTLRGYSVGHGRSNFRGCTSLKCVLFGPNRTLLYTKDGAPGFAFLEQSDCVFFLPRHTASGADSPWYSYREWVSDGDEPMYGTNPRLVFYGPNAEDLDIEGADGDNDGKITFIPRTVHALTNVLSSASTVSRNFDLAVTVSVTNAIDLTNVEITEDMAKSAAYANLMFSAKTQTQLDAILGAFPATTPISIDPTGLTEDMTIPNDYPNVFVKTVPGVTVRRTSKGFMIIFK